MGIRNEYGNIDVRREKKRTSGEKKYAQKWGEEGTITYKFAEVRRVNPKVNTICNMIEEIRKRMKTKTSRGCGEESRKEEKDKVAENIGESEEHPPFRPSNRFVI